MTDSATDFFRLGLDFLNIFSCKVFLTTTDPYMELNRQASSVHHNNGCIFVPCKVNGQVFMALLDTGINASFISPAAVEPCALKLK